jgi:hypothetical protein
MPKHFAFLLDCPKPGQVMMFYDFYENIQEHIDSTYDEVAFDVTTVIPTLKNKGLPYKVFKTKNDD